MVYFAIKGNEVIQHTDPVAMEKWDNVKPQKRLSNAEFLAFENLARVIDGKIFFGKTNKEKEDDAAQERIQEIDLELKAIDNTAGARPLRGALLSIKNVAAINAGADIQKLEAYETRAVALREERRQKTELLNLPY
jgi:hypothetical protein